MTPEAAQACARLEREHLDELEVRIAVERRRVHRLAAPLGPEKLRDLDAAVDEILATGRAVIEAAFRRARNEVMH